MKLAFIYGITKDGMKVTLEGTKRRFDLEESVKIAKMDGFNFRKVVFEDPDGHKVIVEKI